MDDWIKLDKESGLNHNVPIINYNDVSVEEFMERFEVASQPCIINGAADNWPAL